jgi:ketosteroid isomerase-like protein
MAFTTALLLSSLVLLAVVTSSSESSSGAHQIIAAEEALFSALKRQDADALSSLLADDFKFRNAGDEIIGKAEFLKAAISVDGTIVSITSDNMRVQTYGDIAALSGTQKAVVNLKNGNQVIGLGIFTDVFARRNGKWLLVFAHNVDLPDQAASSVKTE